MVALPQLVSLDPTLEAADAALVELSRREKRRAYVGFSSIGHPCERLTWYRFHSDQKEEFDAATLKRFSSGHTGEAIMADRLRMVKGVTLLTIDPATGRQWHFEDAELDGMFAGNADGIIYGLLQAPKTGHVWEHKQTNPQKHAKLNQLKTNKGEKNALKEWDITYYGQAVLYMEYSGLTRHYLTCSTPGERETTSVRTNADPEYAAMLKDRAKRIIKARVPLARISNSPSWWQCQFCGYKNTCHNLEESTS